jgi:uncharacterized protein involved in type VI secretion and phage assembly
MSDQESPRAPTSAPFYGKYRATVLDNADPKQMGRIQVICPDISALLPTTWAMPCVPVAGINMGFFIVPPIGGGVWIEFEQGDPDYPVWVGGFWGNPGEVPVMSHLIPPSGGMVLQSTSALGIVVNDAGIFIQAGAGAVSITVTAAGITLLSGTGTIIVTPGLVDVNAGALQVT